MLPAIEHFTMRRKARVRKVRAYSRRGESPFLKELEDLLTKYRKQNDSGTPTDTLAEYLNNCLTNFNLAKQQRAAWRGE